MARQFAIETNSERQSPKPTTNELRERNSKAALGRHVIGHVAICGASTLHAPSSSSRSFVVRGSCFLAFFAASLAAPGPFSPSGRGACQCAHRPQD